MNKETRIGLLLALAVVVAGGIAWYEYQQQPEPPPAQVASAPPKTAEPDVGKPQFAVPPPPPVPEQMSLPLLAESDAALRGDLSAVFNQVSIDAFLKPSEIVKHIVASVDNLDRESLPMRVRPVPATPGHTIVQGDGEELVLSPENSARYEPFVTAIQAADMQLLAALYFHYYPLFQKAYEELGYPDRYFNDRLVNIIDHLLSAPMPSEPIRLIQPKVFYEYADPDLEALSYGQKMLIRLGPKNEATMKVKLRELRAAIIASKP